MTYKDAVILREKNESRIGKVTDNGFITNEIIIVPSDEQKRKSFFITTLIVVMLWPQ